jgi:phage terminase small subunit
MGIYRTHKAARHLMARLTAKQRRFVEKYCENCGNGVKAVYEAGYKVSNNNSAAATASRLSRNVNIRAQIEAFEAKVTETVKEKAVYTREMALAEYDEAYELAQEKGNARSMCTAIAGKVALCGLDYKPAENPQDFKPMTREELEDALRELDEIEAEAKIIQKGVNEKYG